MQTIINVFTSSRFKSFYWRSAMMVLAGFIALVTANISEFKLDPLVTTILGLVLGEVSKYLNSTNK